MHGYPYVEHTTLTSVLCLGLTWLKHNFQNRREGKFLLLLDALCIGKTKYDWVVSGKLTKSYGTLPFIVDFPIKNGDFPWQNVSSPEGKLT